MSEIPTADWSWLDDVSERFERAWKSGTRPRIEDYLAVWAKALDGGPPKVRSFIQQTLHHWKDDSDLAGIRDEPALAKLPADEQKACRALWSDVDALLKRANSN